MSAETTPTNINQLRFEVQKNSSFSVNKVNKSELPYRREIVGSRAFNLEYFDYTSEPEMHDDVVSYLGEYRFQLQEHHYEMIFSKEKDGRYAIRDTVRGEPLFVKARRVLEERMSRGDPVHREEQEEKGIESLDDQLRFAKTGDRLRWVSPPGPKNEGYGDYGFFYEGEVEKQEDGSVLLHMNAIRIDSADLDSYSKAFARITETRVVHTNADAFLKDARIVTGAPASIDIKDVLRSNFDFNLNTTQARDFKTIIARIEPLIYEVIQKIKYERPDEKIAAFHTLENYFLRQKKALEEERESGGKVVYIESRRMQSLQALTDRYGHEPPKAAGSCGSTGESSSLSLTGNKELDALFNGQDEEYSFDKTGDCVSCGKEDVPVGPCNICQPCDSKIKEKEKAKEAASNVIRFPQRIRGLAA